ncbi:MAG TPA: hypothetical protein VMM79_06720, partial [Longimicrobiales bacterium]|nr:hypothetical protein [Longimicrobiales bacterium]
MLCRGTELTPDQPLRDPADNVPGPQQVAAELRLHPVVRQPLADQCDQAVQRIQDDPGPAYDVEFRAAIAQGGKAGRRVRTAVHDVGNTIAVAIRHLTGRDRPGAERNGE